MEGMTGAGVTAADLLGFVGVGTVDHGSSKLSATILNLSGKM